MELLLGFVPDWFLALNKSMKLLKNEINSQVLYKFDSLKNLRNDKCEKFLDKDFDIDIWALRVMQTNRGTIKLTMK